MLEKFEEKSILELSEIAGGARKIEDTTICFTVHWDGWFNGNSGLFDKIKGNTNIDEFD
jgi:hypothetical protein